MLDSGAKNLLSSVTEGLIQQKTHKSKTLDVQTIIDNDFDEIIDMISDTKNNTDEVSSSIQFELTDDGGTLPRYAAKSVLVP